jgi:hypothetical protein
MSEKTLHHLLPSVSPAPPAAAASAPPSLARLDPAPCRRRAKNNPAAGVPAAAAPIEGEAHQSDRGEPAAAEAYRVARYRMTRHWSVWRGAELVAVVTYRKGAAEPARRLNAAAAAGGARC